MLKEIGAGRHLTTLAFSEAGSRSHFWAPVSRARRNGAGVLITAKKSWVTSAGHANSYVESSPSPEGAGPTDSTLYLVVSGSKGVSVLIPEEAAPQFRDDCAPRNGMMPPPNSEMISPPITE